MVDLTLDEAQLLRLLTGFFGRDHVVPRVSLLNVCGGELPEGVYGGGFTAEQLLDWARSNRCLFTIIDRHGDPRLVVEFSEGFGEVVDIEEVEHACIVPGLLKAVNVRYVTLTREELSEIMNPEGCLDFCSFLSDKIACPEAAA